MTALLGEVVPAGGFEHEVLFYRDDESFLAGLVPFIREGLERDEAVIVAEPRPRMELLRDALGDDAVAVSFLDMAEIGANPARIIGVWAAALEKHTEAGQRLRGIGEPAFHGRRELEFVECQLHEQLLNVAFDGGPAWRLLCPYDEVRLPRAVVRAALHTHPIRTTVADRLPSDSYARDGHLDAFAAPLPKPTDAVLRGGFGPDDVPATRRTVAQYVRRVGLPEEQVQILELAASELATNSIRHGGGAGTVAMWLEPGAVVIEFSDSGHLADPLTGRLTPPLDSVGGRGLYLVHQLCDLVQVRSSPAGTTVRVLTWL
ncbi:sensor histidine kinase [Blastococcus sp. CT_GayMR19]|uniref:sensor histidine kinase n=1 Tax=Blastococcus sp. CT_GayMR19 TaxID=2559608 RepID=UPI0010732F54|nr:sensor histidine kinase [Blastococcus sp. CT_GayMR19]TFV71872.1 sensor histidine kinase [Blastococcus sp. CT_GayMR19]